MTDREPDHLYDALRERLADYGQAPPAPLWAGIRAQLPPPIAQHPLRKRRRKQLALLLGLLLTAAAGWQYWHTARVSRSVAGGQPHLASTSRQADAASAGLPTPEKTREGEALPTNAGTGPSAQHPAASGTLATTEAQTPVQVSEVGSSASFFQEHAATSRTSSTTSIRTGRMVAMQTAAAAKRERRGASHLPGRTLTDEPATAAGIEAATVQTDRNLPSPTATEAAFNALEAGSAADHAAPPAAAGSLARPEPAQMSPEVSLLAWRMASWQLPASPLPLRLRPDTLPQRPAAVVRRWAVQAVAGPALTFRALGSQGQLASSAPNAAAANNMADGNSPTDTRETHGYGFGGQVQARRVLNGRWSLSGGLGYQEYAIERTYLVKKVALPPVITSSTGAVPTPTYSEYAHRDTYCFLTVPVQVGYALGRASHRLRYGLLGGAEAAVYLGGSSAGADGVTRTWRAFDSSPYRSLSLAVSGGADFRYRVSSRLEAVAQPQATYFVSSVARPASGLTPRHLVGSSLRLGMSYDLR